MIVLHFAVAMLDAWGFGMLTAGRQRALVSSLFCRLADANRSYVIIRIRKPAHGTSTPGATDHGHTLLLIISLFRFLLICVHLHGTTRRHSSSGTSVATEALIVSAENRSAELRKPVLAYQWLIIFRYFIFITTTSTVLFLTVMFVATIHDLDSNILHSLIEHIFMPPKLPQKHPGEETERRTNIALCDSLIEAAKGFLQIIPSSKSPLWMHVIKMMEMARHAAETPLSTDDLQRALSAMVVGGMYR
jgi:hypothetical protein